MGCSQTKIYDASDRFHFRNLSISMFSSTQESNQISSIFHSRISSRFNSRGNSTVSPEMTENSIKSTNTILESPKLKRRRLTIDTEEGRIKMNEVANEFEKLLYYESIIYVGRTRRQ